MKVLAKAYFGHWPILVYCAVLVGLVVHTAQTGALSHYFYLLFIPPLLQPFFEWGYHRFVLHAPMPKKAGVWQRVMREIHYDHHQDTRTIDYILAPFYLSFVSFVLGFLIVLLLTRSIEMSLVLSIASVGCYLFYEWMHLVCHVEEYRPWTGYEQRMRKLHHYHHFVNDHEWWGVTSHLADRVFGTYPNPKTVTKCLSMQRGRHGDTVPNR